MLIIDDFSSSGSSHEMILHMISKADATAVGVGVLLGKECEASIVSFPGYG